jgi:hypothetical protein
MPPIAVVFFVTGIAVWANALFFLGVGATAEEGGSNPLKGVGWITLTAGLLDLVHATTVLSGGLAGEGSILLSGLIAIYGAFFTFLGVTEILGLDLRPLGNVAVAVAIVPLFYWDFFAGGWMFRSILLIWTIVFLAVWATTYGRLEGKVLGWLLVLTAVYTFWTPVIILALGRDIP